MIKAQSTIEYLGLICILVAALIATNTYLKRGIQGRMRQRAADISGELFYAPGAVNSDSTVNKTINEQSSTYTVREDPGNLDDKTTYSTSNVTINQLVSKTENILSF